jgi:uncharacterized repeat protein (TIGR01451 family)
VAYNSAEDEYLVVWWGDDNTGSLVDNEREIYGQRVAAATGAEIGGDFRLSDMGPDGDSRYWASSPAVAYNSAEDEYLVVWRGDDDTGGLVDDEYEIFGQRVDAATGAEIGGDLRLSDMGPDGNRFYGASYPAAAYNSTEDEYLVVWQGDDTAPLVDSEYEIYGQRFAVVADLSITKDDSPDPVDPGATLTYILSVNNAGPDPVSSVTVTDSLPSGATFVSASGTGWTCSHAGGVVTCTANSLAVGSAPDIVITVTAPESGGTITNTATVSSDAPDTSTADNTATATTSVKAIAGLSITKDDSPDPVDPGATLTYILSVNNAGPDPASSVTVTDFLPSGATFVSASGTEWACSHAGGVVTCTANSLAVGSAPDIVVIVTAPESGGTITNRATVGSNAQDPSTADNTATATTTVTTTPSDGYRLYLPLVLKNR